MAVVVRSARGGELAAWLDDLSSYLPTDVPAELAEYLHLAMVGLMHGFRERNLSPFLPQHREIIPALLDDIRSVFDQVRAAGVEYRQEEFAYRAYDYGIHRAFYLDWTLYLSKEMY